jgi:hypothetical protein
MSIVLCFIEDVANNMVNQHTEDTLLQKQQCARHNILSLGKLVLIRNERAVSGAPGGMMIGRADALSPIKVSA